MMRYNENTLTFTAPKDKYYPWNTGKTFTLRMLKNAVRQSKSLSECATMLGLKASGDINPYLRYKIMYYSAGSTAHWKNKLEWNSIYNSPYWPKEVDITPASLEYKRSPNYAYKNGNSLNEQIGVDKEKLELSARYFLEAIGEDVERDGLKDSPKRYAEYIADTMNGHFKKIDDYVKTFENDSGYNGPVVVTDLPFFCLCEHHFAPFIGKWDFAYMPKDRILGLSKVVRMARVFQKRPQVQERLTCQIADSMFEKLNPRWVVVRMGAEHFCMSTRGIRSPGSYTYTRQQKFSTITALGSTDINKVLPIPFGG